MKNVFKIIAFNFVICSVVLVLFEILLRSNTSIFPFRALRFVHPEIVGIITKENNWNRKEIMYQLERNDNGPELLLYRPNNTISFPYSDDHTVDTVTTDEFGFCNPHGKFNNKISTIVIGDSFVWCTAIAAEDTWIYHASEMLKENILNMGFPGIGVYEYIQILEKLGLKLNPKKVLMMVYEGNDLRGALTYTNHVNGKKGWREENGIKPRSKLNDVYWEMMNGNILGQKSYLFNFIMANSVMTYKEVKHGTPLKFQYSIKRKDGSIEFNSQNTDIDQISVARMLQNGTASLEVFTDAIERYALLSKENNFEPIIVYMPTANTVYSDFIIYSDNTNKLLLKDYSTKQRSYFSMRTEDLGISFFDLTKPLQDYVKEHDNDIIFYPNNLHLNRLGSKVVAEIVAEKIADKKN